MLGKGKEIAHILQNIKNSISITAFEIINTVNNLPHHYVMATIYVFKRLTIILLADHIM